MTATSGSGVASQLAFTTSPFTGQISTAATLGPITVELEDASGNPVVAPSGGITVDLSSSSGGGEFSATSGGTPITSITMTAGTSTASFFYGDLDPGSPLVTASATGYTSATQTETITSAGSASQIYAFGDNQLGELGDGTTTSSDTPVPVDVPSGVTVSAVAAGGDVSLAMTSTGQMYAWGENGLGSFGNGTTNNSTTPVPVDLPSGVVATAIAEGDQTSFAVTSSGHLYGWGFNDDGQLGNGTTTTSDVPVLVSLPSGVTVESVVSEDDDPGYTMALTTSGQVYDWGDNSQGELGNGTTTSSRCGFPDQSRPHLHRTDLRLGTGRHWGVGERHHDG